MLREFFASGRVIDLALAVIVIEAVVLIARRRASAKGLRPLDVLGQLLAGVCLLLAVRSALTGMGLEWTAAFLSASFPAHLFDLLRRARSVER